MSVNVKGRNIDVTPALKEYVEKKLPRLLSSLRLLVTFLQ